MASFDPSRTVCPACQSSGNCRFHKTYDRYLVDYHHGRIETSILQVTVVRCDSCGHFHAILPDVIIPYRTYSLLFILTVLERYFSNRQTVRELCQTFGIEPPLLYRWKALFLQHRKLWLGILEAHTQAASEFLSSLLSQWLFSDFNMGFVRQTTVSFLQQHRSRYRQQVFRPGSFPPPANTLLTDSRHHLLYH